MTGSSFAERLNSALKARNISPAELSRRSGASEGVVSGYRNGKFKAKQERLDTFARILDVSIPWLMGYDVPMGNYDGGIVGNSSIKNIIPMPEMRKIPLLGTIACGTPILAAENFDGDVDIPKNIAADFALRCKGDSMINARIFDGDIVYIRQQQRVENGEIAAVLIGEEATLKRVRIYEDHLILEPENPQYRPLAYWGEEMNSVRIIGKAVAFTSCIR